ncbi:MAG: TIGR03905 family protein [Desulfuromonas sp.]|mgnify:CR=1 FL=1|nr:MAG: TIGR03905 family protein [Desulfuromonas sp.]
MKTRFKTKGTCARFIDLEIADGKIVKVDFVGGCAGNTQGVASLLEDVPVASAIAKLKGIVCRNATSCPDQLAQALEEVV